MNFGLAFSFVFKDPDWIKKIGFVSLCQLIPILGQFIALGFSIEIIRRVISNDPVPLPDFDFGGFLAKGFQGFIVSFVYSIPMLILLLPIQLSPTLVSMIDNPDVVNGLTIGISCICGGLATIYGIFLGFVLPAAFARLADTGSMGAAFKIGENIRIVRKAFVPYLIAILGSLVASLLAPIGTIACVVGALVTLTYYYAVSGHFYAQAYRQAVPV